MAGSHFFDLLQAFEPRYLAAVGNSPTEVELAKAQLALFRQKVTEQIEHPHVFDLIHRALKEPFDYQAFGQNFIGLLIDLPSSTLLGTDYLHSSQETLRRGDNCIFLANHQIEADPQVMQLMLRPQFPELAEKLFYVAGARVTSDPLAVPFTLGCNILSVHSRNHMDPDPEKRALQQRHNMRLVSALSTLLSQGSMAIYVAPSGGRDRPDAEGNLLPAAFCPDSVELFMLLARKCPRPVHFYPLALSTYALLPPPSTRDAKLGEERHVAKSKVSIACGPELDFQKIAFPQELQGNKKEQEEIKRGIRAEYAWQTVLELYQTLQK